MTGLADGVFASMEFQRRLLDPMRMDVEDVEDVEIGVGKKRERELAERPRDAF